MKKVSLHYLTKHLNSTAMSIVLSVIITLLTGMAALFFKDNDFSLILIRFIFVTTSLLIATISFAWKKQSLFITCIFVGIICFFLHHIWVLCNFIWISSENQVYFVDTLSLNGFFLFLFTAARGALDSLADDGSKELRKYRLFSLLAAAFITVIWVLCFLKAMNFYTFCIGISLSLLTYIAFKQLIIPDIEEGFVRSLRPYNFLLLLIVVAKLVELVFFSFDGMDNLLVFARTMNVMLTIWLFPLAYKGVSKWKLV